MSYLVEKENVYYLTRGMKYPLELNYLEFHAFDSHFARDNQNVFHDGVQIKNADAKSFSPLGTCHSKDARSIYWKTQAIPQADLDSFKVINDYFAHDRNSVFAGAARMEAADPASFKVLDSRYSLDSQHVFDGREIIPDVSPSQFFSWGSYVRVGSIVSFKGQPVTGVNPNSFSSWADADYAIDDQKVFWRGQAVPGADAASFSPLGQACGQDDNGVFIGPTKAQEKLDPSWHDLPYEELKLRPSCRQGDSNSMLELAGILAKEDPHAAFPWAWIAGQLGQKKAKSFCKTILSEIGEPESEAALWLETARLANNSSAVPINEKVVRLALESVAKFSQFLSLSRQDLENEFGFEMFKEPTSR